MLFCLPICDLPINARCFFSFLDWNPYSHKTPNCKGHFRMHGQIALGGGLKFISTHPGTSPEDLSMSVYQQQESVQTSWAVKSSVKVINLGQLSSSLLLLLLSLFSFINFIVLVVINFIFYCFHRFSSYVDQSIYELGLEPFYSSGDGNCFYNSLSILMSGHESDIEIFRLGAAMYGLAHYGHIVDAVRTISYFLLCLLSLLVYNFNVLVLCFKWTLTEVNLWISFSKLRLRHNKSILN